MLSFVVGSERHEITPNFAANPAVVIWDWSRFGENTIKYYAPYFMHQRSLLGIPSRCWGRKRWGGIVVCYDRQAPIEIYCRIWTGGVCYLYIIYLYSFLSFSFWIFWPSAFFFVFLLWSLYRSWCVQGILSIREIGHMLCCFVNSFMVLFCTSHSSSSRLELVSLLENK